MLRDVLKMTKRKRNSRKTRPFLQNPERQTELLRKTFNSVNAAIFVVDAKIPPVIVECNRAASEIFGYKRSEMVGRTTACLHASAESLRKFQAELYPAIEKQDYFNLKYQMKRKDGSVFLSEHTVTQLFDDHGKRIGWVSVVRDATEEKREQEALRASEDKYRTLVENAADFIFMIDEKTRAILSANRSAARSLGKEPEEILGKSIFDLFPKETAGQYAESLNEVIKTGKGKIYEQKMVAGEKEIWISTSLTPVKDPDGKVSSVLGVSRDITERRETEEELRQSNERYHSLFRSMMEGFAYCKMIFDESGRPVDFVYIDVNNAFAPLTGLGDVVGKRVSEVIPGIKETNPELFEIYGRVASTGKPEKFEVDVKPLGISLNISVSSPAKGYFVAVFENTTERKKAEDKVRRSEELYRSLFDSMLDGMYRSTHDGRFVDVNPAFVKMFGYSSKQEMLDIADIKKELYFSAEERGSHILDTGREEVEVYRMRRKDGSEIWVEDHGRYVHDEHGNIIYHEGMLRDVTERKRMEETLVHERSVLRTLMDNLPDNIFVKDTESRFVICNLADARLLRAKTPDEVVGKTDFDLFPRELAASYYDDEQEVIRSGQPLLNREERTIDPEGETRWLLTSKVPLRDDHGKVIGVAGINRDITDRKRLEEELKKYSLHLEELADERTRKLRESEEKYRELFEACPVSLWEEDFSEVKQFLEELRQKGISDFGAYFADHPKEVVKCAALVKVLNMNKATLNLYDAKSVEDVIGGLSCVLPEESNRRQFSDEVVALAQGKKYYEGEMENRTLRGENKHCNVICAVVPGYEQSLAKVLVCIVDLTPQKKLEEELRASKERLEYVVATNPAVLVLERPFANLSNTFSTFVSESAASVFGFEPKNFLGESGSKFFNSRLPPNDLVRYLAEVPSLWSDGQHTFEFRFLHSDGSYRWIREQMKVTRDLEGRILDVVGVCIDVTEQKKLEEKLAKAERLAAIGETAAMVGHDLRNPLQGITGAAYNIRRYLRKSPDPSANEMLAVIDNGVQYANEIINDLLEFSREMQLQLIPTTPKSVVRKTLTDIKIPINITIEDTTANAPEILADEPKLKRLFTNLIQNAIDAMPEGGKLSISSMSTQKEVSISVRDTGCGIPQDMVGKIWTPLHSTKAQGIGLGLPIAKRIIEAHGGSVSVESAVGKGTTFTLKLPIQNFQSRGEPS